MLATDPSVASGPSGPRGDTQEASSAVRSGDRLGAVNIVGRERELEALLAVASEVLEGHAREAAIVGDAGIGKTALARTFVSRLGALTPDARVVMAAASAGRRAPFDVVLRALGLEVPEESDPQRALDRRRGSILDRLGELLVGRALVVLVVEDVHHLDAQTAALLPALTGLFATRPLLVLTTRRPGGARAAGDAVDDAVGDAVRLGPLDHLAIATLVERELGGPLGRRVAREVALRAGGNPLFAEHLVRLARAHGAAGDVADWNLPLTVESAVQAQLDQLPGDLRDAVHGLAVLGHEADLTETRLALGPSADSLVSRLIAAEVIELAAPVRREADGVGWRFRSRIVREVAYAALDAADAARLHRAFAERLAEDPAVDPERVLTHAEAGHAPELARRFARASFLRAARLGDGRRVLQLLPRLEREGGADFTVLFLAAEAAAFVERAMPPETLLERALELAARGDERGAVLAELGERARRAGRLIEARQLLERARGETRVPEVTARARARQALVLVSEGRATDALALLDVRLDALPPAARALSWDTRGYVHGALGALGPRREAYEAAEALYAEAGDARRAAGASANLGDTMRQMGDLAAAEATLRRAADGARRIGNGLTDAYATANLAGTLVSTGRLREALATLEVATARATAVSDSRLVLVAEVYRARAEGRAPAPGDLARARASDPTLCALALACQLELGAPSDEALDEATALLARPFEIEEGALELGRGLHRHRPTDAVRALLTARLLRVYRSIAREDWQRVFVGHVERTLGPIAAPFIESIVGGSPR